MERIARKEWRGKDRIETIGKKGYDGKYRRERMEGNGEACGSQ